MNQRQISGLLINKSSFRAGSRVLVQANRAPLSLCKSFVVAATLLYLMAKLKILLLYIWGCFKHCSIETLKGEARARQLAIRSDLVTLSCAQQAPLRRQELEQPQTSLANCPILLRDKYFRINPASNHFLSFCFSICNSMVTIWTLLSSPLLICATTKHNRCISHILKQCNDSNLLATIGAGVVIFLANQRTTKAIMHVGTESML